MQANNTKKAPGPQAEETPAVTAAREGGRWTSAFDAALEGLAAVGMHVSSPLLSAGLHAQDIPSHIGSQFLAKHGLALVAGCSFDQRAVLRREAAVGVQPGPNVAPVLVIEDAGQSSLTTQNLCGADQSGLFGGDLHGHG